MSERYLVLGGGVAGMSTALELTRQGQQVEVVQMGWRLGGKGASGRNQLHKSRIEEHGLHIWFGFYRNAFRSLKGSYDALGNASRLQVSTGPSTSGVTWSTNGLTEMAHGFIASPLVGTMRADADGVFEPWLVNFAANDRLPWNEPDHDYEHRRPLDYVKKSLRLARTYLESLGLENEPEPIRRWLSAQETQRLAGRAAVDLIGDVSRMIDRYAPSGVWIMVAHELVEAMSTDLLARGSAGQNAVSTLLSGARASLDGRIRAAIDQGDPDTRSIWELIDILSAVARGLIVDGVASQQRELEELDEEDFRDWLARFGAGESAKNSALIRAAVYDLAFAYVDGDPDRPAVGAGTALRGLGRMFFDYDGSVMWKMTAAMGDVVFVPQYLELTLPGPPGEPGQLGNPGPPTKPLGKVRLFTRVERMGLSEHTSGDELSWVLFSTQMKERHGYDPLLWVNSQPKGVLSWPNRPHNEPDDLKHFRNDEWRWALEALDGSINVGAVYAAANRFEQLLIRPGLVHSEQADWQAILQEHGHGIGAGLDNFLEREHDRLEFTLETLTDTTDRANRFFDDKPPKRWFETGTDRALDDRTMHVVIGARRAAKVASLQTELGTRLTAVAAKDEPFPEAMASTDLIVKVRASARSSDEPKCQLTTMLQDPSLAPQTHDLRAPVFLGRSNSDGTHEVLLVRPELRAVCGAVSDYLTSLRTAQLELQKVYVAWAHELGFRALPTDLRHRDVFPVGEAQNEFDFWAAYEHGTENTLIDIWLNAETKQPDRPPPDASKVDAPETDASKADKRKAAALKQQFKKLSKNVYKRARPISFVQLNLPSEEPLLFAVRQSHGPLGLLQPLCQVPEPTELKKIWAGNENPEVLDVTVEVCNRPGTKVINAMPISTLERVAPDVLAHNPSWRAAAREIKTVSTQALQIWHKRSKKELGWDAVETAAIRHRPLHDSDSGPTVGGYVEPFDTWADLTITKRFELHEEGSVNAISYFCNVLPASQHPFIRTPSDGTLVVFQNMLQFLDAHSKALWPRTGHRYPDAFDWENEFTWGDDEWPLDFTKLLTQEIDRDSEVPRILFSRKARIWRLRTEQQLQKLWPRVYVRANTDPASAYVLTAPGSTKFRLWPSDTGYTNVSFAGDWTRSILNAGCVEAAVVSGKLAAESALLQSGERELAKAVVSGIADMEDMRWPAPKIKRTRT